MRGFPHSDDPEKAVKGELWAGVTPSGWSPVIWIPVKRDPEGSEAKGRGLKSPMKPEPLSIIGIIDGSGILIPRMTSLTLFHDEAINTLITTIAIANKAGTVVKALLICCFFNNSTGNMVKRAPNTI
jgi:hypothetical protein